MLLHHLIHIWSSIAPVMLNFEFYIAHFLPKNARIGKSASFPESRGESEGMSQFPTQYVINLGKYEPLSNTMHIIWVKFFTFFALTLDGYKTAQNRPYFKRKYAQYTLFNFLHGVLRIKSNLKIKLNSSHLPIKVKMPLFGNIHERVPQMWHPKQ